MISITDLFCERVVLGTTLSVPDTWHDVAPHLDAECFTAASNIRVYQAMAHVAESGGDLNMISVAARLKAMQAPETIAFLVELSDTRDYAGVEIQALRLRELAMRRRIVRITERARSEALTEAVDTEQVMAALTKALDDISRQQQGQYTTLTEVFDTQIVPRMQSNADPSQPAVFGSPTGFPDIDRRGGLVPSDLIIVAGETSQGKTAFATALAVEAIRAAHPVAIYSMEMTASQLTARISAMLSGIPSTRILMDPLDPAQRLAVADSVRAFPSDLCFFDDNATSSLDRIIASIRAMYHRHAIRGAVIDYLQILNVNSRSDNNEQSMGDAARRLKNLAKELDIWIVALSQLNRSADSPQPTMRRLRASGQIAEAADTVMLVYRPEYYSASRRYPDPFANVSTVGTAMIDVAKGRNSGVYRFIAGFDADTTRFYPLELPPARSPEAASNPFDFSEIRTAAQPPAETKLPF